MSVARVALCSTKTVFAISYPIFKSVKYSTQPLTYLGSFCQDQDPKNRRITDQRGTEN